MRRFAALFGCVILAMLMMAIPASADHAVEWSANGDSSIVDATTVHLEGEDTSVETTKFNPNVNDTKVSFEFTTHGDVECDNAGDVYVFVEINNTYYNTDGLEKPCGTGGKVEFEVPAGVVTHIGIVQYQPDAEEGYTEVSNLMIGEHQVHFTNPEPPDPILIEEGPIATNATCDEIGSITFPDVDGIEWSVHNTDADPDGDTYESGTTEPFEPGEYVVDPTQIGDNPPPVNEGGEDPSYPLVVEAAEGCETATPDPEPKTSDKTCDDFSTRDEVEDHIASFPGDADRMDNDNDGTQCDLVGESSEPEDDTKPSSSQETLPKTGVGSEMLAGFGVGLLILGGALLFYRRNYQN